MTATGTFDPPLGSRTLLASPSSLSSAPDDLVKGNEEQEKRIWFTYLPPPSAGSDDEEGGGEERVAEVWTNLPLSPSSNSTSSSPPNSAWHALPLLPSVAGSKLYTASLPLPKEGGEWQFTYRFRSPQGEVEWLGSAGGNGTIVVVSSSDAKAEVGWEGPHGAEWTSPLGQAERVRVGKFSRGAQEKEGQWDVEIMREWLGLEGWGEREVEGLVLEQSSRTWFAPRPLPRSSPSQILSHLSPTFPAQLLIFRFLPCRPDPLTRYTVLFPFSSRQTCAALVGVDGGNGLVLRCQVDAAGEGDKAGHLAVAWGEEGDLRTLIERCVAAARSVLSPTSSLPSSNPPFRTPKPLGVCTWNALSRGGQTDYSATTLLSWLDSLRSSQAPPSIAGQATKVVLLDDGWQDTETYIDFSAGNEDREQGERRALKSFQCSMEWFDLDDSSSVDEDGKEGKRTSVSLDSGYEGSPAVGRGGELPRQPREGVCVELREVVRRVKEKGVERVGVWITLCGYWHGLHPDRSLADAYTLRRFTVHSAAYPSYNGHIYLPAQSDLRTFYDDYFSSLRAAGVDFVKVDDQATVDCLVAQEVGEDEEEGATPDDVGEYRVAMLEAMRAAAIDAFGADGIIHCMAGSPRVWGGSLGIVGAAGDGAVSIVRNSDDYFPDVPDSHRWHIALNALTTLLSSALRFEPDFDMAQSAHEFGKAHLALRAFSSAQVWMSDEPGADLSGWESLLAMTKQGVRVLQAREGQVGTVLDGRIGDDVLGRLDGGKTDALKVGLSVASAKGAHIGVWNCLPAELLSNSHLTTIVDSKDVANSVAGSESHGSFVLVDPATLNATQVDSADTATASKSPRRLAEPLASVLVAQNEASILTVAQLFDLPAVSSVKSVKIACLGLLDKTVGLAAIRSVEVISGKETMASAIGKADKATGSNNGSSDMASTGLTSSTSSSSTTPSSSSSSNQTLTRPLSPTDRSSFPIPQGRVPFLLAYFAGFFRSSIVPNSSSSTSTAASRTPRTEIHSLARDILRQPVRTVLSEIKALVSFSIFTVFWIVGWRSGSQRMIEASPAPANASAAAPAQSISSGLSHEPKTRLHVELDYLSDRLAFYVSPPPPSLSSLRLFLDGRPIDASVLHEVSSDAGIVEFQVESAWQGVKSQENVGVGGKSQVSEREKPWLVEVDLPG